VAPDPRSQAGRAHPGRWATAWRGIARGDLVPWLVLAVALVTAAVIELVATRNATFFFDDWDALLRTDWTADTFLIPHSQQMSALTLLLLKVFYGVFGLQSGLPYSLLVIAMHLGVAVAVYAYARPRLGAWLALAPALALTITGFGSYELFISFQIGYAGALICGVLALHLVSRGTTSGRWAAAALLLVGLGWSSVIIPFVIATALICVLRSDRWSGWWVPLPALGAFALWWVAYRGYFTVALPDDRIKPLGERLAGAPAFLWEAMSGGVGALTGLGPVASITGSTSAVYSREGPGAVSSPGVWLGVLLVAVVVARLVIRRPPDLAQFVGVLALPLAYWGALALMRYDQTPIQSNYVFIGSVLVTLVLIEAFSGVRPKATAVAGLVLLAVAAMALNARQLLRVQPTFDGISSGTRLTLTAAELAGPAALADRAPMLLIGPSPADWVRVVDHYGPAGLDPAAIDGLPADQRAALDSRLSTWVVLRSKGAPGTATAPPPVEGSPGARITTSAACVVARPERPGSPLSVELALPERGLSIRATGRGTGSILVRRFGDGYSQPVGGPWVVGPRPLLVRPAPRAGATARGWRVRVDAPVPITACSAGPGRA
jgi:hypothetical protein